MPKLLKYSQTCFDCDAGGTSYAKFEAGQCYPLHEDADRHIAIGIAEVIDVREDADMPDKPEKAPPKPPAKRDAAP
ncbi:MAG: hypothetical protein NTX56_17440 [Proteobacteria bacterium]|nr:hypothetical protein [Pseudomonadota bacterium]